MKRFSSGIIKDNILECKIHIFFLQELVTATPTNTSLITVIPTNASITGEVLTVPLNNGSDVITADMDKCSDAYLKASGKSYEVGWNELERPWGLLTQG